MHDRWLLLLPIVMLSLMVNVACTAVWVAGGASAGIGTYKYITGELQSTEEVSLDRAYQATQKGMEDLQFTITSRQKDAFYGEVIARRATGKKVIVKLQKQSNTITEVKIRVGTFGDESMSHEILNTLKKHF